MSDYGLKTCDADGNVILNNSDRITRLIHNQEVAYNETDSIDLPDIEGHEVVAIAYPYWTTSDFGGYEVGHTISISGTTISWTPGIDSNWSDPCNCEVIVFLYT